MKKLLGVIGILALAAAMLPAQGHADLRGSYAPITIASGFSQGCETSSHRPDDGTGTMLIPVDGRLEPAWITFTARSLVVGHENVRSIYIHQNAQQSAYFAVLKTDPLTGTFGHDDLSYFDPAWSYDGKFLAYIKSTGSIASGLYVQEYFVSDDFEAVYGPGAGADSPVGSEWLATSIGDARHPAWAPSSYKLAFDSAVAGSRDIYTVDVDVATHVTGTATRVTFDNAKAEQDPAWSPNGTDICYTTNKFGPLVLEIVNTSLPSADPNYLHLAEPNFAFVTHNNPSYDPTGNELLYDAPGGENVNNVVSIWRLNLTTKAKCEMQFDTRADADPSWSTFVQHTRAPESIPFSYFLMTSQAGNFGVNIWRANLINSCLTPLPMITSITPTILNWKSENKGVDGDGNPIGLHDDVPFVTKMKFPPETKALGYVCRSANTGGEGVRCRSSIFNSPTLVGRASDVNVTGIQGVSNTSCFDTADTTSLSPLTLDRTLTCYFDRRTIVDRITALGLVNQQVALPMTAYSNLTGRSFQGFVYIKINKTGGAAASNVNLISNSPNPFNPVTKINFAVSKAGMYTLRIYNVQGALVKSLGSQRYDIGTHEAMWDGRTSTGGKAASGVYYAKISGTDGDASSLRLVMAK